MGEFTSKLKDMTLNFELLILLENLFFVQKKLKISQKQFVSKLSCEQPARLLFSYTVSTTLMMIMH